MISRRNFLTLASGLLVPELDPGRAYSFAGGWRSEIEPIDLADSWQMAMTNILTMRRLEGEGDRQLAHRINERLRRLVA
jgi:hypothetical protein